VMTFMVHATEMYVKIRQGIILLSKKHCCSVFIQELTKYLKGNRAHRITYIEAYGHNRQQQPDPILLVRDVLHYLILRQSTNTRLQGNKIPITLKTFF
jgi:hypothetical protein